MGNVLKISEAASIALHSMVILAKKNDELTSVKDIATELNVSANHLSKVLQRLTKANLLISIKGYNGGFKLAKNAKKISFLDIYEAIEGKLSPSDCLFSRKPCVKGTCIMGDLISSVNMQVMDYFKNKKLVDFIDNEPK